MTSLLVVVGPTASGKTALAVELAERFDGEIISADSVQVYRHFEVGTGKPSAAERARARHHLIDVVEPWEPLDAAAFAKLADVAIADVTSRGKQPIVCGGTFLWVRALLYGLAEAPAANAEVRARHAALVEEAGRAALHTRLAAVDEASAKRLSPNDFVRVSRALEVFELTGVTMSQYQAQHGFKVPRYEARLIGLLRTREEQDARIAERTRGMFQAGFVDEVRALLDRGFGGSRAMGSVGYKQIAEVIARNDAWNAEELCASVTRATRVFARRQRTWLREQPIQWVSGAEQV